MDLKPVTRGSTLLTFSKANTACVRISILWEPCAPDRAALTRTAGEDSGMIISVSSHVFLTELKTALLVQLVHQIPKRTQNISMLVTQRAGEMAQWGSYWLCKHKDLSL